MGIPEKVRAPLGVMQDGNCGVRGLGFGIQSCQLERFSSELWSGFRILGLSSLLVWGSGALGLGVVGPDRSTWGLRKILEGDLKLSIPQLDSTPQAPYSNCYHNGLQELQEPP